MGSCFGINSQPERKRPKTSFQPQITAQAALPHLAYHVLVSCRAAFLLARWNKVQSCKPPKLRPSPCAVFTCRSSELSSFCHQPSNNVTWDLPRGLSWRFSWSSSRRAAAGSCILCSCGSREPGSPEALGAGVGSVFLSLISGQFSFVQLEPWLKVWSLKERQSLTLISSLQEPQGRQPSFPGSSL